MLDYRLRLISGKSATALVHARSGWDTRRDRRDACFPWRLKLFQISHDVGDGLGGEAQSARIIHEGAAERFGGSDAGFVHPLVPC